MKSKIQLLILLILFVLTICRTLDAQEKYSIPFEYKGISFKEFASKTEAIFNIRFLYKAEWVTDLRLEQYKGCSTLQCILDNLFINKNLYYFIDGSENIIITRDFAIEPADRDDDSINTIKPAVYHKYIQENMQITQNALVEVGNRKEIYSKGKVTISGFVKNAETGLPIQGATVVIRNLSLGISTKENGFYSLTLPRGFYEIQFSFIGYQEKKINMNLYGSGELNVDLNRSLINLAEVFITSKKNILLERSEAGVENINVKSFKLLPTSMGETDLMKSIVLLPGVQSVGEGSAGFNVRGGSADQNLILLYRAPVYNSSHFFGFFSAVNSDIIKDVTLYKGGIPSRYGGRISSVLDIETKEGNNKELAGTAGISPITAHLMVEGPLIKDTLTYLLAARTTYSNWIFGLLNDPYLHNSKASFYDLNGKLTYSPDKNNKLDLSSYFSNDYFRFNTSTAYNYTNNIYAVRWQHLFGISFYSNFSINNSYYKYEITNQDIPTEGYALSHQINSTGLKADFTWTKTRNVINFGLEATRYSVLPGSYKPAGDSSVIITDRIERERAYEAAVYIDDKINLTRFLTLNAGIRMSSYFSFGPAKVYTYSPYFSKSKSTIADTLNFKSGKIFSKYAGPELRASLNIRISDKNSIKINYNRTRQYIHLLTNSTSISPTDTWKLCDYYLKPEIGDQFAAGFYQMLFNGGFESSAEIYYKEIKNMTDFKGGSTLTMISNIEQYLVNMKGKAYGLELSLKKTQGKIHYSIGYTYSRTFVKSRGKFRDEIINSGNWYPANYDRPNDLILIFQYLYSRRLSFTADYTYSSGRPITYPLSTYSIRNILLVDYSERNRYRIPYTSRLDISCKVSGNLRSDKIANPNLTFSVYNLFGRRNPYSVYFKKEDQVYKGYLLSVFARAIPSVTFDFDF